MKKINPKENIHKTPRIYVVWQQSTSTGDNEQFSLYQIWDNTNWYRGTFTNPNSKYTQITLSHKYKPKNLRFTNTKYELHTNQRESHKSNPKVAMHQERENQQTAKPKPSGNKPLSPFQIATHKYQRTKQKRASLSHTHTLDLPQQHSTYIGDLSWLAYPKPRRTRLLFHTQKENHSYSKKNSKSSSRQEF